MTRSLPFCWSLALVLGILCGCEAEDASESRSLGGGAGSGAGASPNGGATAGSGASSAASAGSVSQSGGDGGASSAGSGGTSGAFWQQAGGAAGGEFGASLATAGAGGAPVLQPLEECAAPSIDRLTSWQASGEGATVPATGSILVQEGEGYVGKVQFLGSEWHVIPVLIANQFGSTADLSAAQSFTLTYSATSELHVQLRSKDQWSGGNQYATTIPATGGEKETRTFSFAAAGWQSLFGEPVLSYADTLKQGMGMVFVGNSENTVVFYGLRFDGYTPACP